MKVDLVPQSITVNKDLIKRNLHTIRLLAGEYRDKVSHSDSEEARFIERAKQKGTEINVHQKDFLENTQSVQFPLLKQINFFAKQIIHELARPNVEEEDEIDIDSSKFKAVRKSLTDEDVDLLKNLYEIMLSKQYLKFNTEDERKLCLVKNYMNL